MSKTYHEELIRKTVSAEEAVKVVKSGDWVAYSHQGMFPKLLDNALAKRKDELLDVSIRGICPLVIPEVAKVEPKFKHLKWHTGFMGHLERALGDRCQPFSHTYAHSPLDIKKGFSPKINVAFMATCAMDKNGFFNFGVSCSYARALCDSADIVIVETNEKCPVCLGGEGEGIHISEIDYVVEGTNEPIMAFPQDIPITDAEQKIAAYIVDEIEDRSCLQLGFGPLANYVGKVISQSGLKDLGMHSEMLCDSFVDLFEAGILTGKYKNFGKRKMVYTFALGTERLYDFVNHNPLCATYPVETVNDPYTIACNDKAVSINNILMMDIYGQACAEMANFKHISGTGGQVDFVLGAYYSQGGKSFLCMPSTRKLKDGKTISRIVPFLPPGFVVTDSRQFPMYVVTEYGKVQLHGRPAWEKAEKLISISHPDFRDDLIKSAQKQNLWTRTSKLE